MSKNRDRIAIVTGASRQNGIGAAICRELADAGHSIFFTYWTTYDQQIFQNSSLAEPLLLKKELEAKGVPVGCVELDLTTHDAPEKLLNQVEAELGTPSILINNACYSTNDNYSNITFEELDRHYFVNIRTTTLLSSYFARRFKKGTGGRIINLTSGQFQRPMPGELSYATTKGAIEALTYTLAAEVGAIGITVNAINPGPTDTGWMTEPIKDALSGMFPTGRVGAPRDAARLVKFLASEEGEWITGQTLHSEGGFDFRR